MSPVAARECRCHKINVGAAQEQREVTLEILKTFIFFYSVEEKLQNPPFSDVIYESYKPVRG